MNTNSLVRNLKNMFATAGLVAMAAGFSGCGKDIKSIAKAASKELGVPVTINTDFTDVCAERQLSAMSDEWDKFTRDDKRAGKRLLRAYKGINVNATTNVAKMTGEATVLYLGTSRTYKIINDKRKLEGPSPKTVVEKTDVITITAQGAVDESDKTVYVAVDKAVYDMIDKEDSPVLAKGLSTGAVVAKGKGYGPLIDCGNLANIHELF